MSCMRLNSNSILVTDPKFTECNENVKHHFLIHSRIVADVGVHIV